MSDAGRFSSVYFRVMTPDGRNFILLEDVWFQRPESVGGEHICISRGTQSDGASTPAALWALGLPPFGNHWRAAFVHDFLYRNTLRAKDECDTIFYEAMIASGVPEIRARWFYNGVCEVGQRAFDEDRQAPAAQDGRWRDVAG